MRRTLLHRPFAKPSRPAQRARRWAPRLPGIGIKQLGAGLMVLAAALPAAAQRADDLHNLILEGQANAGAADAVSMVLPRVGAADRAGLAQPSSPSRPCRVCTRPGVF